MYFFACFSLKKNPWSDYKKTLITKHNLRKNTGYKELSYRVYWLIKAFMSLK